MPDRLSHLFRRWRRSLIYASLLRIAIGGGLLIAWLTITTYYLIFRAVEERGLIGLDQYVAERARSEEAHFIQVRNNLHVAAQAFIERYQQPDAPDYLDRLNDIVARDPDLAWRSPRERFDGRTDTTTWIHKDAVLGDELTRRTLVMYDTVEKFRPAWLATFRSLWACTPEMTNVGFDPLIPNWVYNTPADWNQNDAPWVGIALPAQNPERELRWTYSVTEEVSGEYYVSVCLPVYLGDRFMAIFGHDIRVLRLIERGTRTDITGMTHMMVRDDGRIIAHPGLRAQIMETHGNYSMRDDPTLARIFQDVAGRAESAFSGYDHEVGLYYAVRRLEGPGWYFITTLPRAVLQGEAFKYAQWVLLVGITAVVILLGFLFIVLHRGVARPLAQLTAAVDRLSAGSPESALVVARDDELGQLATAFNRMAATVAERDTSLRQLNLELEKRIAERTAELRTSEERVRAMLENAPEAIVVVDADTGRFVTGNENALRFFGVDRDTLRQCGPADLSPPTQADARPSREVAQEHIAAALAGAMTVFEWVHRSNDGTDIPCEIRLSLLPSTTRKLVIGTITDISERKQAEASLRAALARERELNEMKSSFVSMVSHEFRTPLGIISSSAEILHRYLERLSPAQRGDHLESIVNSTRRINGLIEEVILLGKVESGRLAFAPRPIELASLCSQLVDEVLSSARDQCSIEVSTLNDLTGASGDESLLRHVFSNLLSNAVKYSEPGEPASFSIERDGAEAVFHVRDRGIGIPPDDLRDLFTAFHRGANVGTRPGTGLGLVIVQRCVRIHGGTIDVESHVGAGTHFTVRLPLFAHLNASHPSRAPAAATENAHEPLHANDPAD